MTRDGITIKERLRGKTFPATGVIEITDFTAHMNRETYDSLPEETDADHSRTIWRNGKSVLWLTDNGKFSFRTIEVPAPCPICLGVLWVCENHPNAPWDDEKELGCTCGAGKTCSCNPHAGMPPGYEIIAQVEPPKETP